MLALEWNRLTNPLLDYQTLQIIQALVETLQRLLNEPPCTKLYKTDNTMLGENFWSFSWASYCTRLSHKNKDVEGYREFYSILQHSIESKISWACLTKNVVPAYIEYFLLCLSMKVSIFAWTGCNYKLVPMTSVPSIP